jgi:hypothetical protein
MRGTTAVKRESGLLVNSGSLSSFTLFPSLTTELRVIVFKYALPPDNIFIRVSGYQVLLEPESDLRLAFELVSKTDNNFHASSEDVRDIGLSDACRESREIFLRKFNGALPTYHHKHGVIRFSENSTIYIDNLDIISLDWRQPFATFYGRSIIPDTTGPGLKLQDGFSRIRHLVTPIKLDFNAHGIPSYKLYVPVALFIKNMAPFKNLESLALVESDQITRIGIKKGLPWLERLRTELGSLKQVEQCVMAMTKTRIEEMGEKNLEVWVPKLVFIAKE